MRGLWFVSFLIFAIASGVLAQVKVSGGGVSAKPDPSYSIQASENA